MVLLGGGELDLGDGGDAPRVLHLPRRLLDALAQHGALAVQPRDLKQGQENYCDTLIFGASSVMLTT